MYKVTIVQKKKSNRKSIQHPIYIRYYYNRDVPPALISTHVHVRSDEWDKIDQRVNDKNVDHEYLNNLIDDKRSEVMEALK